jgi:hypothetical protein
MRVNVHELGAFVRICADLRADRLVLRPLNYSPGVNLDWERAGYRFEYQKELLPFDELVRVSGRAAELCRQHGVELADQMDFGGSMGEQFEQLFDEGRRSVQTGSHPGGAVSVSTVDAASVVAAPATTRSAGAPAAALTPATEPLPSLGSEHRPACTEPWKSLYILRRGVFPCCYGGSPVAPMDRYREAWNSPVVQAIRGELAQGRFHDYCLRSPACPIVRKSQQAQSLPSVQSLRLRARSLLTRLDRLTRGLAGRAYRGTKWLTRRAARAGTDPGYLVFHAKRLLGSRPADEPRRDQTTRL